MEQIIEYIKKKYSPLSIIVYGSYASATNNLNSDFDALVISQHHREFHDTSFVDGVQLDVFVYPSSYFEIDYYLADFVRIFDGKIVTDTDGKGQALQSRVLDYMKNRPSKTSEEIRADIDWCVKMFERVKRNDAEGMFRWHWLLTDSLEIFCDAAHHPYLGPKKSLAWMKENHPQAFACYEKALSDFSVESLSGWISYLKNMV